MAIAAIRKEERMRELLTAKDVAALLRVSRRTVSRLRARGELPAPVELSASIVRWRLADIEAYLARMQSRQPRQLAPSAT
jgi:excisionase family DNA binding protein